MKIALIDLDTSHPPNWIPIERDLGHEIACIYDGGSVHPPQFVEQFAKQFNVPRVCRTLEETVALADCAIVHGCDWDTHLAKARPFIEAGRAVLLDKPLAGNYAELRQIRNWAVSGARIAGGSSLRFCKEVADYLAKPLADRGAPNTVFCGCAVDDFNYAIHAYAMVAGLLGGGAKSVRHLGRGVQRRVQINWADGRFALLVVGEAQKWMPFYASVVTDKTAESMIGGSSGGDWLYRSLLVATLPYLARQTDTPPTSPDEFIEPELWALAARMSWENDDREVLVSDLAGSTIRYDGKAFAEGYRKAKYPG